HHAARLCRRSVGGADRGHWCLCPQHLHRRALRPRRPAHPLQPMSSGSATTSVRPTLDRSLTLFRMLLRDPYATVSALFLMIVLAAALVGPFFLWEPATKMVLNKRNLPPFSLENGWIYILGADSLGRSMLARIIVGAQTSLTIASAAVLVSMTAGGL